MCWTASAARGWKDLAVRSEQRSEACLAEMVIRCSGEPVRRMCPGRGGHSSGARRPTAAVSALWGAVKVMVVFSRPIGRGLECAGKPREDGERVARLRLGLDHIDGQAAVRIGFEGKRFLGPEDLPVVDGVNGL